MASMPMIDCGKRLGACLDAALREEEASLINLTIS